MTRRDWNRVASVFEAEICNIVGTDYRRVLGRALFGIRSDWSKSVVVDLGCGIGTFIKRFGHKFKLIYGVDYSKHMLDRAQRLCGGVRNVRWVLADIRKLRARSVPKADLIVCLNVITSASAAVRAEIMRSVGRVTSEEGWALVVVPSLESEIHAAVMTSAVERKVPLFRHLKPGGLVRRGDTTQKYFTKDEIVQSLGRHTGFGLFHVRKVWYPWSAELEISIPPQYRLVPPWDWLVICKRSLDSGATAA